MGTAVAYFWLDGWGADDGGGVADVPGTAVLADSALGWLAIADAALGAGAVADAQIGALAVGDARAN